MNCTPSKGLRAWKTRKSSTIWINPPIARAMNQTSVSGPKKRATFSVPRDCTENRTTRMAIVIGRTTASICGATSLRPSTADSTEMAGVITASP